MDQEKRISVLLTFIDLLFLYILDGNQHKRTCRNTNMIREITVKNYKSIVSLNMHLSKFNVFIGANGCGKSNILESIALAAASSANKLEQEYFDNRGIRFVDPLFMLPAFEDVEAKEIEIIVNGEPNQAIQSNIFFNQSAKPPRWEDRSLSYNRIMELLFQKAGDHPKISDLLNVLKDVKKASEHNGDDIVNIDIQESNRNFKITPSIPGFQKFMIYSLEESRLRSIDDKKQIRPLGNRGEGLLPYLKELSQRPNGTEIIQEINENLKLLDWFEELSIPSGQLSSEVNIRLHDSYLRESLEYFDQRSTNEGFLYLLFYLTLIISDETPSFFAIENIDASFNPKLCKEVTRRLIELAKKHNKQIIATTHNPAILDALDLDDDDEKLLVVRRSVDGHTKINPIKYKPEAKMSLSEAWLKGLIGGLPNNF